MQDAIEVAGHEGSAAPLLFLRKFLRHGTRVASFAPSSRFLARAMCRHVSRDMPQTIVELGAGTGAVTKVAAEMMHAESRLIAVELDADFAAILRREVVHPARRRVAHRELERHAVEQPPVHRPIHPRHHRQLAVRRLRRTLREPAERRLVHHPRQARRRQTRQHQVHALHAHRPELPAQLAHVALHHLRPRHCRGLRGDYLANLPGK